MDFNNNQSKGRAIMMALMGVVLIAGVFLRGTDGLFPEPNKPNNATATNNSEGRTLAADELTYKGKAVRITKHAQCRMDCRNIDAYEIDEVIKQNKINQRKSNDNPGEGKCPTVAYEGETRDGPTARIIVGECDDQPIIITVIDLDNEYQCDCK